MLTLNTILRREGINPSSVRLLRHADTRGPGPSPYNLWLSKDGRFEWYQRLQKEPVKFGVGHLLASFVAPSPKETLFVGLYSVEAVAPAPPGTICPILQTDRGTGGHALFDIRPDTRLSQYIGLLVIEWGPGYRSWVQRAELKDKPVLEIRK
jgi:hypothetical protein